MEDELIKMNQYKAIEDNKDVQLYVDLIVETIAVWLPW